MFNLRLQTQNNLIIAPKTWEQSQNLRTIFHAQNNKKSVNFHGDIEIATVKFSWWGFSSSWWRTCWELVLEVRIFLPSKTSSTKIEQQPHHTMRDPFQQRDPKRSRSKIQFQKFLEPYLVSGEIFGKTEIKRCSWGVGSIRVTNIYSHVKNCSTRSWWTSWGWHREGESATHACMTNVIRHWDLAPRQPVLELMIWWRILLGKRRPCDPWDDES
jgi:hypothetical protein